MFRTSRRRSAVLAALAIVVLVASPVLAATAKRSLTKLVERFYGVPVSSMIEL